MEKIFSDVSHTWKSAFLQEHDYIFLKNRNPVKYNTSSYNCFMFHLKNSFPHCQGWRGLTFYTNWMHIGSMQLWETYVRMISYLNKASCSMKVDLMNRMLHNLWQLLCSLEKDFTFTFTFHPDQKYSRINYLPISQSNLSL